MSGRAIYQKLEVKEGYELFVVLKCYEDTYVETSKDGWKYKPGMQRGQNWREQFWTRPRRGYVIIKV